MNRLYQKNEIWFAIAWIITYVVGSSAAETMSDTIGVPKLVTVLFHVGLSLVVFFWMRRKDLLEKYGLCRSDVAAVKFLYYIPLIIMGSCNLWYGVKWNMPVLETLFYVISMICVGFLEEIIFRGFLFRAMSRDSIKWAILVSSVTFGIGHILNLFNGSGMDVVSNLCQICNAIAFGFLFVIIFYRGKSLLPCIFTHSTINVLSAFTDESSLSAGREIIMALVLAVMAVAYTGILLKTLPERK